MEKNWFRIVWATLGLTAIASLVVFQNMRTFRDRLRDEAFAGLEHEALTASRTTRIHADMLAAQLQRETSHLLAQKDKDKAKLSSEFAAVALLSLNSQQKWQGAWLGFHDQLTWHPSESQLANLVDQLPTASVGPLRTVFSHLQEPALSRYVAFMIPVKKADSNDALIALGLVPTAVFSQWSESFKGSDRDFHVIDDKGFAVAMTASAYIGTTLERYPLISEVLRTRPANGRSESRNLEGKKIAGVFQKVEHTNLYIIVSRPFPTLGQMIFELGAQAGLIWLAIWVLVIWGLWLVKPVAKMSVVQPPVAADAVTPVAPSPTVLPNPAPKPMDRNDAYRLVGPGLVQALRGPLSVILGHAQLASTLANDAPMREHLENVEKEARRIRETLEALGKMSGLESPSDVKRVAVQEVALQALQSLAMEIQNSQIRVVKNLETESFIMAHPEPLQKMLIEIFKNSIEAMEGRGQKEIRISSEATAQKFRLTIEDTGEGIQANQQASVFDPFFTTKSREQHSGLGLTMARGLMRSFGGELKFESQAGVGSKVVLEWPNQLEVSPYMKAPVETPPSLPARPNFDEIAMAQSELSPVLATPPTLGGRTPLPDNMNLAMPEPPRVTEVASILTSEEAEEWQQMPRQLHSDDDADTQDQGGIQIRKPKVRVRIGT